MSVLAAPFHALITGNAGLTAQLATYNSAPAIFTQPTLPQDFDRADAGKPWIITDGDSSVDPLDLTGKAWLVTRDVLVLDHNDGLPSEVDTVAIAVRDLFRDTGFLTVSGHRAKIAGTAGPVRTDPDEETFGRTVSVRVMLEEV